MEAFKNQYTSTVVFKGKANGPLSIVEPKKPFLVKVNLIFGVTGQDGSYLAEELLSRGETVYGVARRTSNGNTSRISGILEHPHFHLLSGDITDFGSILSILNKAKPNRIYNLAAQSHVGTSFEQGCSSLDITAKGCVNILEAIRLYKALLPKDVRMYQASSSEMFGDSYSQRRAEPEGFLLDEGRPLYRDKTGGLSLFAPSDTGVKFQDENTRFNPQSPYAIAKLAAHNYCGLYRNAYGLDIRCGILFNHESERRGEEFVTRKITKYLGRLHHHLEALHSLYYDQADELKDKASGIWNPITEVCDPRVERRAIDTAPRLKLGNIESSRDWGHARDYIKAMILIMEADEPKDYVVATGNTYTIEEFLTEAFRFAECGQWRDFVDFDDALKRPCEVPFLKGDASLIKKDLGWKPSVTFEELINQMIMHDIGEHRKLYA